MKWYYAEGGQQAGPIEDAQFRQLVLEGRIRGETLVWREGMPEWLPYQAVYEQSQGTAGVGTASVQPQAAGPDQSACVECGRVFNNNDMISYGTAKVCADCKPIFLQKLSEGVPVSYARGKRPMPVNPDALLDEVLSRGYQIDIGSCISRGWQLVKKNLGIAIGATVLVMLCNQASGFVPVLGIVISILVQGPLMGGLNVFFLKLIRGEPAGMGDAFSGFSKKFWPLCGTMVLMMILIYAWIIPAAVLFVPAMSKMTPGSFPSLGWLFWVFAGVGFIGMIWLGISFIFALPLCADLELSPWNALRTSFKVVSKHWFAVFGLIFVAGLLSALGLLACIIGVFFTMPIFYAAMLYAYEDIFGVRS